MLWTGAPFHSITALRDNLSLFHRRKCASNRVGNLHRRLPLFRLSATDGAAIEDTAIEIDVTGGQSWASMLHEIADDRVPV